MRRLHRFIAVVVVISSAALGQACGEHVARTGVLINEAGVTKERIGPSTVDVFAEQFVPGTGPGSKNFLRLKTADLTGDGRPESIVEIPDGKGLEITDQSGAGQIALISTNGLIDFGAVPASREDRSDLVIYTYPGDNQAGTFTIQQVPERRIVATWDELPAPPGFATGRWRAANAIWYFRDGKLVIRDVRGQLLFERPVPEAIAFRDIDVLEIGKGRVAVLTSGNGYTPYHMVCILDPDGKLAYQEVAREHGRAVRSGAGPGEFDVFTRSVQWRYHIGE